MEPTPRGTLDAEAALVTRLLAWGDLFGHQPLSWVELRAFGLSLTRQEAEAFLGGGLLDPQRAALYAMLLEAHPELRPVRHHGTPADLAALLQRLAHTSHFLARLTEHGGPPPQEELASLRRRARTSRTGTAWIPTRERGGAWRPALAPMVSTCLFYCTAEPTGLTGVLAEVRQRSFQRPEQVRSDGLYAPGDAYGAWWEVARPTPVWFPDLASIPGRSRAGKSAQATFGRSRSSFAYWDFGLPLTVLAQQFGK